MWDEQGICSNETFSDSEPFPPLPCGIRGSSSALFWWCRSSQNAPLTSSLGSRLSEARASSSLSACPLPLCLFL